MTTLTPEQEISLEQMMSNGIDGLSNAEVFVKEVVKRMKTLRTASAMLAVHRFSVGDSVTYTHKEIPYRGTITKLLQKKIAVKNNCDGRTWHVPAEWLRALEE